MELRDEIRANIASSTMGRQTFDEMEHICQNTGFTEQQIEDYCEKMENLCAVAHPDWHYGKIVREGVQIIRQLQEKNMEDRPKIKPLSRLQVLKYRIFGKRITSEDSGCKVTGYAYKNRICVTKVSKTCQV